MTNLFNKAEIWRFKLVITKHAEDICREKGFDMKKVSHTFANPTRVYESGSHKGQYRVTGNGLCLVGQPKDQFFTLITVYADQILTAPRPDQMKTPEGKAFADRYTRGLGRSGYLRKNPI